MEWYSSADSDAKGFYLVKLGYYIAAVLKVNAVENGCVVGEERTAVFAKSAVIADTAEHASRVCIVHIGTFASDAQYAPHRVDYAVYVLISEDADSVHRGRIELREIRVLAHALPQNNGAVIFLIFVIQLFK